MFDWLSEKFSSVFSTLGVRGRLNEHTLRDAVRGVRTALLDADVPHDIIERFIADITTQVAGQHILKTLKPNEQFIKIVYEQLVALLSVKTDDILHQLPLKSVVLVCGLNGAGKTTSVAKLGVYLTRHYRRKVMCASLDFSRPAAIEQLTILTQQASLACLYAAVCEPVAAVNQLREQFNRCEGDVLIIDTAGRLHVDDTLLTQLRLVRDSACPAYTLLVLDAMTGQESLRVAQAFDQAVGFDGALLTKVDSDTRGGAAFAFAHAVQKPVILVGTGEQLDDLERFYPDRAAQRLLGMGDLDSLLERANQVMNVQQQQTMSQRLMSGEFTLEDFAQQLAMMSSLGSLQSIMRLLPGGITVDRAHVEQGEREARQFKIIIDSMTRKERQTPHIINKSRINRIANGAGVPAEQVRTLLNKFEQSKQFVKLLSKSGSFRNFIP